MEKYKVQVKIIQRLILLCLRILNVQNSRARNNTNQKYLQKLLVIKNRNIFYRIKISILFLWLNRSISKFLRFCYVVMSLEKCFQHLYNFYCHIFWFTYASINFFVQQLQQEQKQKYGNQLYSYVKSISLNSILYSFLLTQLLTYLLTYLVTNNNNNHIIIMLIKNFCEININLTIYIIKYNGQININKQINSYLLIFLLDLQNQLPCNNFLKQKQKIYWQYINQNFNKLISML
ncbi:transmembrane protein, putative (macronuclear) [Tetrahymena thermophila SB210]|uniref:Transmembrane protein, putative n=1 Tax=Tetrahymena thermophila (strain SB210) TaxID=312017 RepID=W7X868_TETTS|nr:transmembrane protein, putative [Tetrahymena thermophila SB210]EWS72603.1 transmembrane protein, putative [Tetrahymena thermophila SB210]|eukprot:XP_012654886.1 transmembrane protein, putative [Tetrahymena thermophila SB210]